jgi:hypothetical protein
MLGIGLVGVAASVLALGPALPAAAGNNGQQLEIGFGGGIICVNGLNQNGHTYTDSDHPCWSLPGVVAKIPGWWWIGQLQVELFKSDGTYQRTDSSANVNVPKQQGDDYWYFEEACCGP